MYIEVWRQRDRQTDKQTDRLKERSGETNSDQTDRRAGAETETETTTYQTAVRRNNSQDSHVYQHTLVVSTYGLQPLAVMSAGVAEPSTINSNHGDRKTRGHGRAFSAQV